MTPPDLLQTVCPCGCRAPVLVAADKVAAGVTCPNSRRRYGLPAGKPLKLRFGRKQWDACRDVRLLRQAVTLTGAKPSGRKKRLAAAAVAETCLDWCKNAAFRQALQAAREIADTGTTKFDCLALSGQIAPGTLLWERLDPWRVVGLRLIEADPALDYGELEATDPLRVAGAVHEVLPNPFRVPPATSAWRTPTVTGLAAAIDTRGAFCDLPILADALEEAGCTDRPTLDHLRGGSRHAVGCWALDWVGGWA